MAIPLAIEVVREDMVRIAQSIFQAMLAMEVEVKDLEGQNWGDGGVTASIHLGGAWNGAVFLQCPVSTACELAASMLGIEKPAAADDDVKDVMGELINMVAGNFKALLGGGTFLSGPLVVEGADYRFRILTGEPIARVELRTPAGPAVLTVVEVRQEQEEQHGG